MKCLKIHHDLKFGKWGEMINGEVWEVLLSEISILAPKSQQQYLQTLKRWCEMLKLELYTTEAASRILISTKLDALNFIKHLQNRKGYHSHITPDKEPASASIAIRLVIMKRLFNDLITADLMHKNPFNGIDIARFSRKPSKRPSQLIPFEKVLEIINSPSKFTRDGIRDRAILALLFGGAFRNTELRNLLISDVKQTQSGTVYLYLRKTKSGKPQTQVIAEWAANELKSHIKQREKENAGGNDYLFQHHVESTTEHRQILPNKLRSIFREYTTRCGVPHVTPHCARATAITKLLDDGMSYREVQEFSRHSSTALVEVYDKRRYEIDQSPAKKLDYKKD
jgi:site-specific recombinase XerD